MGGKYLLAKHVYASRLDDSLVILDVRSNDYLAIPPESLPELEEKLIGFSTLFSTLPSSSKSEPIVDTLFERGILTESPTGHAASPITISASSAVPPGVRRQRHRSVSFLQALRFSASVLYVWQCLRRQQLERALNRLRILQRFNNNRTKKCAPDQALHLLDSFLRMRTLTYTAHEHCLFNALILAEFLIRHGVGATFVIGVRTKPFGAHAWVQIADSVIDDRLEAIQNFTPILTV